MGELILEREIEPGDAEQLRAAAAAALDGPALSGATRALLADRRRRAVLQEALVALAAHSRGVIVGWASVMVGSGPYTDVFDRHVELQGRLDWICEILTTNEPGDARTPRDAKLARSSVAAEHAATLGTDEWLHDQIVATVQLATRLDYESRALGFELVPLEWWNARTQAADRGPQRLSSQIRRRPSSVSRSSTTSIVAVNAGTRWWASPPVAIAGASTPSSSRRRPTMPSTWQAKP